MERSARATFVSPSSSVLVTSFRVLKTPIEMIRTSATPAPMQEPPPWSSLIALQVTLPLASEFPSGGITAGFWQGALISSAMSAAGQLTTGPPALLRSTPLYVYWKAGGTVVVLGVR